MATLNFEEATVRGKKAYVAEFQATDAVNVHFEREKQSAIVIYQRIANSVNWAKTKAFSPDGAPLVFDENFVSDVTPIYWRIESYSPVTDGILTEG